MENTRDIFFMELGEEEGEGERGLQVLPLSSLLQP